LFPDTFNNFFHPETAMAAAEVLEAAGFDVSIPPRILCCGRPLYAWGMLDQAKAQIRTILRTLKDDLAAGVPVVGLEPACVASFRDEIPQLFPDDPTAKLLQKHSYLLSDFLANESDWRPSAIGGRAVVHAHCHHHAVFGTAGEETMLDCLGLDYHIVPSGCCGMAGAFGFEANHYEVAMKIGERVLLPAVRAADPETLIITNGFSCREQIVQATGRPALHIAEAVRRALDDPGEPR
jgi:Fe-S oxidoreductase